MPYLIGFGPWIAFFLLCATNHPSRHSLVMASVLGLLVAIILIVPSWRSHRISSVEIGGLIFFPLMALVSVFLNSEALDHSSAAISQAALTLSILIGVVSGHPFTLSYARSQAPMVLWNNKRFMQAAKQLANGWLLALALITSSSIISVLFEPTSLLSIFFAWVIPVVIVVFLVQWHLRKAGLARALVQAHAQARIAATIVEGHRVLDFIDYVTTRVSRAQAAPLFNQLRSIGLIEAWKLTDYGDYISGAVRLGNVNLEILGADDTKRTPAQTITFEPASLTGLLPELARRGIEHGSMVTQKNGKVDLFTRVELPGLSKRSFTAQLCATMVVTRTESPLAPENPACIVNTAEVRISTTEEFEYQWRELLAPLSLTRHMDFGEGPALSLQPGHVDQIASIAVRVSDLRASSKAFAAAGFRIEGTRVTVGTLLLELTPGS